jgi:hypothetical protein
MSGSARAPAIHTQLRYPPQPYAAPTAGSVDERLADIAKAINSKADRIGIPNVTAIQMTGQNGLPYLLYVDATGTLKCDPVVE